MYPELLNDLAVQDPRVFPDLYHILGLRQGVVLDVSLQCLLGRVGMMADLQLGAKQDGLPLSHVVHAWQAAW
jgi:hypothetical protein